MSRTVRSLCLALVASFALVSAAIAAPAKTTKAAATHAVVGTIQKYDATSKMLTITTAKGTETVNIGDSTHVMSGAKAATAADLAAQTGSKVKVSYKDQGGQKMASSVRISAATSAKSAAPKSSASKTASKSTKKS